MALVLQKILELLGIRIVICGPAHSGKSVFTAVLMGMLPRERFMLVEGAPDGEGITGWSHQAHQSVTKKVRRKGKFLPAFIDHVCLSVSNSTAPITVVDVGGVRSPENERIFSCCTHFIVISSKPAETAAWIEFGERLGVKLLAVLDSTLEGEDEIFDIKEPLRARITKLDRMAPPVHSPSAKAVADQILAMTAGLELSDGSDAADVNFPALAKGINLPLRNSGPDREWAPEFLSQLVALVATRFANQEQVNLWGNTPAGSPYHVLAANLQQAVGYYDPKVPGFVVLPALRPQGGGDNLLHWQVEEREDHTLIEFVIPGQIFDVRNLPFVVPPAVNPAKGVVISGKAPRWLTGALARAYAQAGTSWVAVFEPQLSGRLVDGVKWGELHPDCGSAVIIASSDEQHPIGEVFPFALV